MLPTTGSRVPCLLRCRSGNPGHDPALRRLTRQARSCTYMRTVGTTVLMSETQAAALQLPQGVAAAGAGRVRSGCTARRTSAARAGTGRRPSRRPPAARSAQTATATPAARTAMRKSAPPQMPARSERVCPVQGRPGRTADRRDISAHLHALPLTAARTVDTTACRAACPLPIQPGRQAGRQAGRSRARTLSSYSGTSFFGHLTRRFLPGLGFLNMRSALMNRRRLIISSPSSLICWSSRSAAARATHLFITQLPSLQAETTARSQSCRAAWLERLRATVHLRTSGAKQPLYSPGPGTHISIRAAASARGVRAYVQPSPSRV